MEHEHEVGGTCVPHPQGPDRRGLLEEQIAAFLEWEQAKDRCRQYKFLARQRACLLEQLHQDAARLDCLDHLVFIMRQAEKQCTDETEGICIWKNNCI